MAELTLTQEQKERDSNTRIEAAMAEIKPILEKHAVDFHAVLRRTENAMVAVPVLRDTKYDLKPSPIIV